MFNKSTLNLFKISLGFVVIMLALFLPNFFVKSESSSDAIAIRIIPNPNHYSASRWYYNEGFMGSPQSTIVDGYRAVRDGRTVYVNVANINSGNLYTNIYLISYNQDAQQATIDIFSEILSHWKFNTNITSLGHCREETDMFCLKDDECPIGDFCDSPKARIVRDVRRMADLAEVKILTDNYYKDNAHYPILSAGTYLPNRTVSVWPSWKNEFSDVLGRLLSSDPVNKLGECLGYNEITCWDEYNKTFASALPDLPDNSLAYNYMSSPDGSSVSYCAVFESGLVFQGAPVCELSVCLDFDNDGWGNPASSECPNSGLDCNDNDPNVQAGSPENCVDGIDNDCDGLTDCDDADCLGNPGCSVIPYCGDDDCEGSEDCFNCEEDCGPCLVTCPDAVCDEPNECQTGSDPCSADCFCGNGSIECGEGCDDGNNNNGDGCSSGCLIESPCSDGDSDGYDACDIGGLPILDCDDPCDCDDGVFETKPSATEICNGIDDDCNSGTVDGSGESAEPNENQIGECAGNKACMGASGWQDSYSASYEITESSCADFLDNDCDGIIDCADPNCASNPSCGPACGTNGCEVGEDCDNCPADCGICCGNGTCDDIYGENCDNCEIDCGLCCGNGTCENIYGEFCDICVADCGSCPPPCTDADNDSYDACDAFGLPISGCDDPCDCDDSLIPGAYRFPGNSEKCDGYDNDCDPATAIDVGCDDDGDFYCDDDMQWFNTTTVCDNTDSSLKLDCDDENTNIHPGASEDCNGIDDDCDAGTVDGSDEIPLPNTLNLGVCAGTNQACVSGLWQDNYPGTYETTEVSCDDGLDNDCDGLTDCDDSDCECNCIFTLTLPCDFL